ncbi:MAG: FAD-dependent oxidoreductase [Tissierellia bacterium]|nr:FAD-dependent oxidoreductase [Tissierellia bacterium]
MNYDYIIIGNGIAGYSALKELAKDTDKKTLIISKEKENTYYRTQLSHFISKDFTDKECYVCKDSWYKEHDIDVKLDCKVTKINTDKKTIITENDEEIGYEKLLIATGARAFVPPIKGVESDGVFAIRTLDDLKSFKKSLEDSNTVIIIGGGILGLEAAKSIQKTGRKVVVIESFDYILNKQLDNELSLKLKDELEKLNIIAKTGKNTTEILSEDGKVSGVKLDDGEVVEGELILVQTGIRSNIEIAKNSGLETDRGIMVNKNLKVEDKDIYVAGDAAQIGKATMGLWTAAMEMGQIAGKNMLGDNLEYDTPKPFSLLNLDEIKLFSAGSHDGEEMKKEDGDKIYKLFKKDDKIIGGILWQDTKYMNDVKKIVFEGKPLEETKLKEIFE